MRVIGRIIPVVLFLGLGFFFWRGLFLDPQRLPSVKIGKSLPAFDLPILNNKNISTFTPALFQGQITLLTVWASWCSSCIEEQAFLMELARTGFPVYGLNYEDEPEAAKTWLKKWGNPYRLVGEDRDGHLAMDLGVYGTPETFLIDAQGRICYRHTGPLNKRIWNEEFLPRVHALEGTA